eukprot:g2043.t1
MASSGMVCHACKHAVSVGKDDLIQAEDRIFHSDHFRCNKCQKGLNGCTYVFQDGVFFCDSCSENESSGEKCAQCNSVIEGEFVEALGKLWHPAHFFCFTCRAPFTGSHYREADGLPFCEQHYRERQALKCARCEQYISDKVITALGKKFHPQCFVCDLGSHQIAAGIPFYIFKSKILCHTHYEELVVRQCYLCMKMCFGQFIRVKNLENAVFHTECWEIFKQKSKNKFKKTKNLAQRRAAGVEAAAPKVAGGGIKKSSTHESLQRSTTPTDQQGFTFPDEGSESDSEDGSSPTSPAPSEAPSQANSQANNQANSQANSRAHSKSPSQDLGEEKRALHSTRKRSNSDKTKKPQQTGPPRKPPPAKPAPARPAPAVPSQPTEPGLVVPLPLARSLSGDVPLASIEQPDSPVAQANSAPTTPSHAATTPASAATAAQVPGLSRALNSSVSTLSRPNSQNGAETHSGSLARMTSPVGTGLEDASSRFRHRKSRALPDWGRMASVAETDLHDTGGFPSQADHDSDNDLGPPPVPTELSSANTGSSSSSVSGLGLARSPSESRSPAGSLPGSLPDSPNTSMRGFSEMFDKRKSAFFGSRKTSIDQEQAVRGDISGLGSDDLAGSRGRSSANRSTRSASRQPPADADKNKRKSQATLSLQEVLAVPEYTDALQEYLESQHAAENLSFLREVQLFSKLETTKPEELARPALQICRQYVGEKAPKMVNLDAGTVQNLQDKVKAKQFDKDLFEECREVVMTLLSRDVYRRFLQSQQYADMLAPGYREERSSAKGGEHKRRMSFSILRQYEDLSLMDAIGEELMESGECKSIRIGFGKKKFRSILGSQLVYWLMKVQRAKSKPTAITLCQRLFEASIIAPQAENESCFLMASTYIVRTAADISAEWPSFEKLQAGHAFMRRLLLKGVRYHEVFAVIATSMARLYLYRDQQGSLGHSTINLKGIDITFHIAIKGEGVAFGMGAGVTSDENDRKVASSSYMQLSENSGRHWIFLIEKEKERQPWMNLWTTLGLAYKQTEWPML